ncbi:MAG TPA: hypothetical protein VMU19_15145 [Bryobacteraceae bacterium]|nr:hypothetical protein [Bryobacteraceae bacterium]
MAFLTSPAWAQLSLSTAPGRTTGHPVTPIVEQNAVYSAAPNLVEGREFYQPEGVAVDTTVTPTPIYVSDTGNNRVLGWKDASSFVNGQKADIVIGQNDFFTTWAQGPTTTAHAPGQGSPLQSGLSSPTGLAAINGDLYVVDSGNNRVLRYPQPFSSGNHIPNLVIGQSSLAGSSANYTGAVSAQGVSLSGFVGNIAFDPSGNLWMTDPGNRRVLEFAASDIAKSNESGPVAIVELGQADFTTLKSNLSPTSAASVTSLSQFAVPAGIGFDAKGRLYVSDYDPNQPSLLSRVLVFTGTFTSAMSASNYLGVYEPTSPPNTALTKAQLGAIQLDGPLSIFFTATSVGVVDSGASRILLFPPYEQWPAVTAQVSASATAVMGQNSDFTGTLPNNESATGTFVPPPTAGVFFRPFAAAYANSQLYLADTGNSRTLAIPEPLGASAAATRWLGQDLSTSGALNLLEGREFQFLVRSSSGAAADSGIAIDYSGSTPHLYVADTYNNRILGYKNLYKVSPGVAADIVIGQPNGQTGLCNFPTGDSQKPTPSSLCNPVGLAVDSKGNLWVADRGNGRALRFPAPFAQTGQPQADVVLGQPSLTSPLVTTDSTNSSLAAPYGVAVTSLGYLAVSDQIQNRVMVFIPSSSGFTSGQAASFLVGQLSFNGAASGSAINQLSSPHHIAVDSNDRLYVADSGNNRVNIYDSLDNPNFPAFAASAAVNLSGFSTPEGVYVNPSTGEIWVADTSNGLLKRFPPFITIVSGAYTINQIQSPALVMALAQDQYGSLIAADSTNRLAFYFPGLTAQNMANGLSAWPIAPGLITSLMPANAGAPFGSATSSASSLPLPLSLSSVEVLFQGVAAPLFMVSPSQINFMVPNNAPTSGPASIVVDNPATGQVYASGQVNMNSVSPGLFLNPANATGQYRQAAIVNFSDGSMNSAAHPALRGSWVEIFGTGEGFVPGAPPDGTAASGPVSTSARPVVYIGGVSVDDAYFAETNPDGSPVNHIYYSGLAPGLVGVWQIDVKIPMLASPGNQVPIAVFANSLSSLPSYNFTQYITTIAIQ